MKKNIVFIALSCSLLGCSTAKKTTNNDKNAQVVEEKALLAKPIVFTPGIPAYTATDINYKRGNKILFNVNMKEPVVVSVAAEPEKWGYFQFPSISVKPDGSLTVRWSMNDDSMTAYGKDHHGSANSTDGGKTWQLAQEEHVSKRGFLLPNGDQLEITTPIPIKTDDLKMPKPIGENKEGDTYTKRVYHYYKLNDLPAQCQAVYLKRLKKGETEWKDEQATLLDPNAARHTTSGVLPVVWWGDMHIAGDGSLIAGIYPGSYIRDNGTVDPKSAVFFYRSTDNGHSWKIQGRIFYHPDTLADVKGNTRMGFTEPAYEILKDGTFLCVARTTDGKGNGPMYASYSKDMGKTWTEPVVLTQTGVLPRLMRLGNGVIVLASGRPGVQLRFAVDGKGKSWSDPFEMLPYESEKEQVSCGYTGLLATGANSFIIVYSDFMFKTRQGDIRKAIKVREVTVTP